MNQTSLTFKAFKNATYNILGFLWPMLFTLLVTPLIIIGLGIKEYGVYLFVTSVIALMANLDLGLGTAVIKHLSFYYGRKDEEAIRRLSHSANSLFFIIGITGAAISATIAFWGPALLPAKFAAYSQYSTLFLIGGGLFLTGTISATADAVLIAVQRFDINTKISMLSVTLSSLSMLAVIRAGGTLTDIFWAQLAVSSIVNAIIFWQARKLMPAATFGFGWNKEEIKHCYRFGLVYFVNSIAGISLTSLDRLIIPLFAGPSNLTYYSIPGNVTAKIPSLANTLGASIFPTVSELSGSEETARIRNLYVRSFRLITIIASALTVTTITFSYKLLAFWLDADIASHASGILVILAATSFILALFNPLSNFLLGLGKIRFLTLSSLSMGILNVILLVALLPSYGIVGAAWAYLLSVLPVFGFLYYVEKHYLDLEGRVAHYGKTILGIGITSCAMGAIDAALGRFATDLLSLLAIGGASALLFVILYRTLGFFEEEDWRDLEHFSRLLMKKAGIPFAPK